MSRSLGCCPSRSTCVTALWIIAAACASGPSGPNGQHPSATLQERGHGSITTRYTSEIDGSGHVVYTTTWYLRGSNGGVPGDALFIWDVSGDAPALADSVIIDTATTTGDVQISDDGAILGVATEYAGGSVVIFSLADPLHPKRLSRFHSADTDPGVHTVTLARVAGTQYGFLCVDPSAATNAKLVVISLADPSHPVQLAALVMGNPYVHDVFVRDGILFTALWNDGLSIWDIGGGGRGGTPGAPVRLGSVVTVGGNAHNVWWLRDATASPASDSSRYAVVGEEQPGAIGTASAGDIHVLDVHDLTAPQEVAFFHVAGAGTHNFDVDEAHGILYAGYYNGGVRAIDVRGALGSCTTPNRAPDGRCDLAAEGREFAHGLIDKGSTFVWGVKLVPPYLYASDMLDGLWKLDALVRP